MLYFRDNARLATRKIKFCSLQLLLQFYAFIFLICGIVQFGASFFHQKLTGKPDIFCSYYMLAEGYIFAILIWARSRTCFIVLTFYFLFRLCIQMLFHLYSEPLEILEDDDFLKLHHSIQMGCEFLATALYFTIVVLFPIIACR